MSVSLIVCIIITTEQLKRTALFTFLYLRRKDLFIVTLEARLSEVHLCGCI